MAAFLLWCILFLLCWPIAILALVLYPIVWLILLPFRIVGIAVGGLLSFLRGQPQVFFFDVTEPRSPKFIGSHNPSDASITDEFAPLSTGGFLATFMGGPGGAHPGRRPKESARKGGTANPEEGPAYNRDRRQSGTDRQPRPCMEAAPRPLRWG